MHQSDQIKVGDIAVLMGYYFVVAERARAQSRGYALYDELFENYECG
jgi:hypothetical protein